MEKTRHLLEALRSYRSLAVALSGGVDSSVLTRAAAMALGDRAVAVTASSELLAAEELTDAKKMAALAGIRHEILPAHDLELPELVRNDPERCYYCKKGRFSDMLAWAQAQGYDYVAEGSNLDDRGDYRPGMRAIAELPRVVSPFMECGWTKADIRQQAREWELPVWDKPSAACLASRVEYGIPLTARRLEQVEAAEKLLRNWTRGQLRVRHHGSLARIEVEPEGMPALLARREEIAVKLKALGFTYVTLDLSGYRMGSQNEILEK